MGFFSDLKEDLSQAVSELIPAEENKDTSMDVSDELGLADDSDEVSDREDAEEREGTWPEEDIAELMPEEQAILEEELPEEPLFAEDGLPVDIDEMLDRVEEMNKMKEVNQERNEESVYVASAEAEMIKSDVSARKVSDETATITANMKITGDITSEGSLELEGMVTGNIDLWGKLNVSGCVVGDSKAAEIFADNAKITGEIRSMGSVKIGQSTVIIGNIYANSAVIAGAVKGDIDVQGPVILDTSAIVMGNIKSKSVQINNGAVIEGMCSQIYAEVNPTSFFEELKKGKK